MNFFKSVFAEDSDSDSEIAPPSPSDLHTQPESPSEAPNPNPNPNIPAITNAWTFGSSLLKTLATKSESVVEHYRKDFEEFSSGLKKETATIREVASRAVTELPARLESGAAVAQGSLESIGEAIDTIGSTVTEIILQGKDSILANDFDSELSENSSRIDATLNAKPYSRIDALLRAIQCDAKTYCQEPEDLNDYGEWKLGFILEEKSGEIEDLIAENAVIGEIFDELVPTMVDEETFWSRYFYKEYRIRKAEEARARVVKRAISGEEEEELSWDVDDEDNDDIEVSNRVKSEIDDNEENVEKLKSLHVDDESKSSVNGEDDREKSVEAKSDGGDEKESTTGSVDSAELSVDKQGSKADDRGSVEGKNDNSDFSVVSSQLSSHEEDLGWDEIEDASGDEIKVPQRISPSRADLRKRLSASEVSEELTWDIEDDDESSIS